MKKLTINQKARYGILALLVLAMSTFAVQEIGRAHV